MLETRTPLILACAGLLGLLACDGNDADGGAGGTSAIPNAGAPGGGGMSLGASGSSLGGAGSSAAGSSSGGGGVAGRAAGGAAGSSGAGASAGGAGSTPGGASGAAGAAGGSPSAEPFSFFVTSVKALVKLSGNDAGFGGDLTFGETGAGAGLRGADKICSTIAEASMPGNRKTWRAFLSANKGENGQVVNAIDRVGEGPWYDRLGRLVAKNKSDLAQPRPVGADEAIKNDLPNEDGVPNHDPDGTGDVDNHDMLTGSGTTGQLFSTDPGATCNDWTSKQPSGGPRVGHSWPRTGGFGGGGGPGGGFGGGSGGPGGSGENWMSALTEAGCAPGIFLIEAGPPGANGTKTVGDGGGYGGFYCFALTP